MKILTLYIILTFSCISSCMAQNSLYKKDLMNAIKEIHNTDTLYKESILKIIPKSEEEYLIFYSLTSPDTLSKIEILSYYKMIDLIYRTALNSKEVYKFLLEMSVYVDGEFAESYFEDLENIMNTSVQLFCQAFYESDKIKTKRLQTYFANCK